MVLFMNKLKNIIIGFSVCIIFFWYLNGSVNAANTTNIANTISFESFVQDIKLVENSKKDISIVKFYRDFNIIKNNKCSVSEFDSYVEVSSICLLGKNTISALSTEKSLDYLIEDLWGFWNYYSLSKSFSYKPTSPYFRTSKISWLLDDYDRYTSSIYKKIVITYLENQNIKIRIENSVLAKMMFTDYSFYVVPTDLSMRSACSLANYRAAVSHLDWVELAAGEELNLNNLISYDPNSCKWTTPKKYMFYAGACGSSTQLFRLSLLMPYLDVIERYPHSKRWAFYYGSKVYGDDAAMYENSKKMIIKNTFNSSIYFKVYEQWNKSYLVWVVPKKILDRVEINKTNKWLSSSVRKNIYNSDNKLINIYQFDSSYSSYNPYRS